jgi:hypothetical protein
MLDLLNTGLSAVNGYFEGRTVADVHTLKEIESIRFQMQLEKMTEEEKVLLRKIMAARKAEKDRRFKVIGRTILVVFGILTFIIFHNSN